ncbi:efflux RND transporter periplasmic adaptor subunit [Methyloversatilis thermotolerans]|uniref:efflux RND transporter periplasmic adaptor subunit n=1 Tax=Methyloversatilis thermotolerans TaxID=1346290 RepID=UPI0012FC994A|nr:efflux RND transporter periplasmic adaptor subunit [Methyloversatilis thermotolerans]
MTSLSSFLPRRRRVLAVTLPCAVFAVAGLVALRGDGAPATVRPEGAVAPAHGLTLPPGASQLSFVVTAPAVDVELPVTAPLNARIAMAEDRTARLFSPLAGRIVKLGATLGDTVAAGVALAVIDAPDLGQAAADQRRADADADLKRKALDRARTLMEAEVLPRREFEVAQAESAAAEAEAKRARLRLSALAPAGVGDGQSLALHSPFAGTVVERNATPGLEVRPDAERPLFVVSDLSSLWLVIDLPEQDLGKLRVGDKLDVRVEAWPERRFDATVARIAPLLDPQTRRVQVRCSLPNPGGELRPEMFARASVLSDSGQHALRVPTTALVSDGLYTSVFVQTAPGRFEKRRVHALRQDAREAYVTPADAGALKGGDSVVVRGALLLDAEIAESR